MRSDPGRPNAEEREEIASAARRGYVDWESTRRINAGWDGSNDGTGQRPMVIGGRGVATLTDDPAGDRDVVTYVTQVA